MTKLEFSISLPAQIDKLFPIAVDFENYKRFFDAYLNSVRVITKADSGITTEEVFTFRGLFKHEIIQESLHVIQNNEIRTKVISGPFRGSTIDILFVKNNSGTKVTVIADYRIAFKYKIVEPIIKQKYKIIITGLLYKMNTLAIS